MLLMMSCLFWRASSSMWGLGAWGVLGFDLSPRFIVGLRRNGILSNAIFPPQKVLKMNNVLFAPPNNLIVVILSSRAMKIRTLQIRFQHRLNGDVLKIKNRILKKALRFCSTLPVLFLHGKPKRSYIPRIAGCAIVCSAMQHLQDGRRMLRLM